jgi:hypothetical protein
VDGEGEDTTGASDKIAVKKEQLEELSELNSVEPGSEGVLHSQVLYCIAR